MTFRPPIITPKAPPKSGEGIQFSRSLALITAVVAAPFVQTDWARAERVRGIVPGQAPVNQNLYAVPPVAAPFAQLDWSSPHRVSNLPPAPVARNPLIYSEVPFRQLDWLKATHQPPRAPDQIYPDIALLHQPTEFPFAKQQWERVTPVRWIVPQATPYNDNLFRNPVPFAQLDWSKPFRTPDFLPPFQNQNTLVYAPVIAPPPFAQYNWRGGYRIRVSAPRDAVRNPTLFSEVPIKPPDLSQSRRLPRTRPEPQPYNGLIYSGVPFHSQDWSKPIRSAAPSPDQLRLNFNLFPVPRPFAQLQWTALALRINPAPPASYPNINMLVPPPPASPRPFSNLDWMPPFRIRASLASLQTPYIFVIPDLDRLDRVAVQIASGDATVQIKAGTAATEVDT